MGEKYNAESAEIWALGVLLYTVLHGEVPFKDPSQAINGPYLAPKVKSSPDCMHLLDWMLEKNPAKRATIFQAYMHPWFRRYAPQRYDSKLELELDTGIDIAGRMAKSGQFAL